MAEANFKIRLSVAGVSEVSGALNAIQGVASRVGGALASLAGIAGITTGLAGMAAAIGKSVSFNAQLEQQAVAFKTLLGNADAATQRMKELSRFAAETPFELPEIVQASKVLQSLTNGALASGEGLRLVGDAAAATGRPLEEAAMWIGRLYAGLQSGTPVGEATLRLLEMGLISGTTSRKLNELAQTGEGAGQAMTILRDTFGRLGGAMADQSQTFSGLISTLKDTFNMALADIGKPLFNGLKQGIAELIPVVESVGYRIGAWTRLAVQSWRDGNLGEFIGLTIQAGIEAGMEALDSLKAKFMNVFLDESIANAIGNATVTMIAAITKSFIDLNTFFQSYWNAVGIYAAQAISGAIRYALNQQISAIESVLNLAKQAAQLMTPLGRLMPSENVKLPRLEQTVPNFDQALSGGTALASMMGEKQKAIVDKLLDAYRDLFGIETKITDENGKQVSAREKLKQLIDRFLAEEKAASEARGKGKAKTEDEPALINARLKAQQLELFVTEQIQGLNQARAEVESSWLMTSTKKYEAKVYLLEQEKKLLVAQREELTRLAATPGISEADRMAILKDGQQVQGRINQTEQGQMQLGPDPNSFSDQFSATLVNLQDQFGTVAQQMAQTFADVFNSATASISTGIQGLIMGTMSWGEALRNIGSSIVQSLVKSFADMVAGWIMSHVIMKGVSASWSAFQSALRGKDVVEANATEAAKTPLLAANATLASVASFGVAAVVGIAAIVGILSAVGAFKEGGYTGSGDPNQVAGVVHRGEYVIPADAVSRIGLDTLESMRAGETTGAAMPTSAGAPSQITLNMGVFDNPARLNDWARSQDGRTVLVDIMRQHAHEVGNA